MGSFDVACGLSNLTIHSHDKIGLVILASSIPYLRGRGVETPAVREIYVTDRFTPYLPPIFGTYDGYGHIKNIVTSPTTSLLEDMFQRPIQEVLDCIGNGPDVYSSNTAIYQSYMKSEGLLGNRDATNEEILLSLGFAKVSNLPAYSYENYLLFQDFDTNWTVVETWNSVQKEIGVIKESHTMAVLLNHFSAMTNLYPGFDPEEYRIVKALSNLSGMFFLEKVFTKLVPAMRESDDQYKVSNRAKRKNEWDNYMSSLEALSSSTTKNLAVWERDLLSSPPRWLDLTISLPEYEWYRLIAYNGSRDFSNVDNLYAIATATNRSFAPTFCGSQKDDEQIFDKLNAISAEILAARHSKR